MGRNRNRDDRLAVPTRPTDGRDVPSVRISLQSLDTVSPFSLSVHSSNVVSIYPPAVCTHPLPSQRLSRHQWTLTQRTEHRHISQTTHPLPLSVHFLTFVCIYPPAVCMHTSSRSQRTDTPLSYSALTSVGLCLSFVEQCTHARTVRTESPTHNVEHSPAVCAHPFCTDTAH